MKGVWAFLWLASVMIVTVCVAAVVLWFIHHGASMFVNQPH